MINKSFKENEGFICEEIKIKIVDFKFEVVAFLFIQKLKEFKLNKNKLLMI